MDTPLSVIARGRIKNEPKVVAYVKNMLMAASLKTGVFNLVINTKIQSGGIHHKGVEIKDLRPSGIRLTVQYGDNGTRFECFLSSAEFKPSDLRNLLISSSKIKNYHYIEEEHPRVVSAPIDTPPEASVLPDALPSKAPEEFSGKSSFGSLKGSSKNAEDVELILTAIREKHGLSEFTQYEFHQIVVEKINTNASRFVSGQLIRRLGEAGHLKRISGKRSGKKKFQIFIPTLDQPLQPTDESGSAQMTVLEKKVVELKGQIKELETALTALSTCNAEIEDLESSLANVRRCRESLLAQVSEKKMFIDSIVSSRTP